MSVKVFHCCLNQSVEKEILKEVENANPVRLEGEDDESQAEHIKWIQKTINVRRDERKVKIIDLC